MSTRYDRLAAAQPFRRTRLVEGGSLAIELHIAWVNARPIHPRVIQVVLPSLNQHDLQIVVQIGKTPGNHASGRLSASQDDARRKGQDLPARPPSHHNDVNLVWQRHNIPQVCLNSTSRRREKLLSRWLNCKDLKVSQVREDPTAAGDKTWL